MTSPTGQYNYPIETPDDDTWNYPIETPTSTPPSSGSSAPGNYLNTTQQSAYDALTAMLKTWGLDSLAPSVLKLIQDGHDQTNIPALLQDTDAYKQRFAGNEIRKQRGMPVLSPAEYLSTEQSYRQILQSNGLPSGFYDSPSDFSDWIGKDVSPQEIQTRVGLAVSATQQLDAGTTKAFNDYYGVSPAHLTSFFLDQDRALPQIQQAARAATIGGAGFDQGLNVTQALAQKWATSNIADANLNQQMQQVATDVADIGKLSQIYGGDQYGLAEAGADEFFQDAEAKRRRQRLTAQEQATFNGDSGVGKTSLARSGTGNF